MKGVGTLRERPDEELATVKIEHGDRVGCCWGAADPVAVRICMRCVVAVGPRDGARVALGVWWVRGRAGVSWSGEREMVLLADGAGLRDDAIDQVAGDGVVDAAREAD